MLAACGNSETDKKPLTVEINGDKRIRLDQASPQRFQLATNPVLVLDTITGQAWRATAESGGSYQFVRVCYRSPTGPQLMPTPWENQFKKDLSEFQRECSQK